MRTGENGRTAIAWTQTELDGLEAAPLAQLTVGASWSWRGRSINLNDSDAIGLDQIVFSNAASLLSDRLHAATIENALTSGATLEISNGAQRFIADLMWISGEEMPVLIFANGCPERDQDFWISYVCDPSEMADHQKTSGTTVVAFPAPRPAAAPDLADMQPLVLTAAE